MVAVKSPEDSSERLITIAYDVEEDELTYKGPAAYRKKQEIQLKQLIRSGLIQNETDKLQQKRQRKSGHPKGKRSAEELSALIVNKPSPTVETMKELLPDMMDAVYYSDEARLKIAGKWQTRPDGWPKDVRLVPPGNYINEGGQKRKTRLADLKPMYDVLRCKLLKIENMAAINDKQAYVKSDFSYKIPKLEHEVGNGSTDIKGENKNLHQYMALSDSSLSRKRKLESRPIHFIMGEDMNREVGEADSMRMKFMSKNSPVSSSNRIQYDTDNGKLVSTNGISRTVQNRPDHVITTANAIGLEPIAGVEAMQVDFHDSNARVNVPCDDRKLNCDATSDGNFSNTKMGVSDKSNETVNVVPTLVTEFLCSPSDIQTDNMAFQTYREPRETSPVPNIISALLNTDSHQDPGPKNRHSSHIDGLLKHHRRDEAHNQKVKTIQPQSPDNGLTMTRQQRPETVNTNKDQNPINNSTDVYQPLAKEQIKDVKDMAQNCINVTVPAKITWLPEHTSAGGTLTGSAVINRPLNMAVLQGITPSRPIMSTQPSLVLAKAKRIRPSDSSYSTAVVNSPVLLINISHESQTGSLIQTGTDSVCNTPVSSATSGQHHIYSAIRTPDSIVPLIPDEHNYTPVDIHASHNIKDGNEHNTFTSTSYTASSEVASLSVKTTEIQSSSANHRAMTSDIVSNSDNHRTATSDIPSNSTNHNVVTPDESDADLLLFFSESHRDHNKHNDMTVKSNRTAGSKKLKEEENWRSVWNRKIRGGASNISPSQVQKTNTPNPETHIAPPSITPHHLPVGFTLAAALSRRPPRPKVDAKPLPMPLPR